VLSLVVRLLRTASIVICLIVIASFAVFVVDQTKSASGHQQEELTGESVESRTVKHESGVHKTLDEASAKLTSPFSGVVSGSHSEWLIRGVKLILALLVYGFGLGYIARVLRVRV
jgi:hypothetical protein